LNPARSNPSDSPIYRVLALLNKGHKEEWLSHFRNTGLGSDAYVPSQPRGVAAYNEADALLPRAFPLIV
ncbi:MAG: hypothetical protein ACRD4G_19940, partial [Bryobacteraceae bacterium]